MTKIPDNDGFILEITEATTLGQIQVVYACLGVEMRERFVDGRYVAHALAQGAIGRGEGPTLSAAIRGALLDVRAKLALRYHVTPVQP